MLINIILIAALTGFAAYDVYRIRNGQGHRIAMLVVTVAVILILIVTSVLGVTLDELIDMLFKR